MAEIARLEGARGLYRGCGVGITKVVPEVALYYSGYFVLHDLAMARTSMSNVTAGFASGLIARLFAAAVTGPLELVRTNLQSKTDWRRLEFGRSSINRAVVPTLLRDVPFSAMYWGLFEGTKDLLWKRMPGQSPVFVHFLGGLIAGSIVAGLTTPLDVVKTRRQVGADRSAASLLQVTQVVVRHEGVRGLFRGIAPRVLRTGPACAIMIGAFQFVLPRLSDRRQCLSHPWNCMWKE